MAEAGILDAAPHPPTPPGAPGPVTPGDYRALARARTSAAVWDFVEGGGGDEWTLRENTRVFERVCLRPSVLVDVGRCDQSVELLGCRLAVPFGVAPLAFQGLVAPEGELATVAAAGEVGALTVVSVMASRPLAEVAAAATGPLWFQLYWLRDRGRLMRLVRAAEDAGYRALVLTVDLPRMARRPRDLRRGFALPADVTAPNLTGGEPGTAPEPGGPEGLHVRRPASSAVARHAATAFDPTVTWDDVAWLRGVTELPLVLKGVITPEDARRAVACGARALVVSNHGGRQLDGVPPALAVLADVRRAVDDAAGDGCDVLMDGGVRSGTDVLKALALGARAVLVGRPVLWGLAAGGRRGVADVLTMLRDELDAALALSGRPTLAHVDGSLVAPADRLAFPA